MIHMRPFTLLEQRNMKYLVNKNISFTMVQITATGLKKSILDATEPMRAFFFENGIHDYSHQAQGEESKVYRNTTILSEGAAFSTKAAFYRPVTKKGDPRLWIYGLKSYTQPDDIHLLFVFDGELMVINMTRIDIQKCCQSEIITPIKETIEELARQNNSVADELLQKFRSWSGEWFESEVKADTGIGRSIETMLGIQMNASKAPDYKGIELKSARDKRSGQKNALFTQTPDWELSKLKSGRAIVEKYGYFTAESGEKKTLQVTVSATRPNQQTLALNVNQLDELLEMQSMTMGEAGMYKKADDVAAWRLLCLHDRLKTKHHETFWITVENQVSDGKEYYKYKEIEHTKNPIIPQFDVLLGQGEINLDLMLGRPSGRGDTYSFKIKKRAMPLLFPESIKYTI